MGYKVVQEVMHGIPYGNDGKKTWTKIGVVVESDDGKRFIKINYLPHNWDGNAGLWDPLSHNKRSNTGGYKMGESEMDVEPPF